jgi:endoglucanase
VPDIDKWADTVQLVVTAIRNAGAKTQMILIPGNDWTSAQQMPTKSGPALLKVKNPDGSTDNIVFDVHSENPVLITVYFWVWKGTGVDDSVTAEYLDSDNSGTHTECVTDNISTAFSPLADWLRTNKRQALNSETGGGNTASCQKYLCQQIDFLK